MSNIPDSYELFQRHESELDEMLEKLPVCCCCENHIQDDTYYNINGDIYCKSCLNEQFLRFN